MHMYFLKGALATSAPAPSVLFGIQNLLFHVDIHSKQSRAHPTSNGAIGPEKEVPSERGTQMRTLRRFAKHPSRYAVRY